MSRKRRLKIFLAGNYKRDIFDERKIFSLIRGKPIFI